MKKNLKIFLEGSVFKKLDEHPGILVNVFLEKQKKGKTEQGLPFLQKALRLCPGHPVLLALVKKYNSNYRK